MYWRFNSWFIRQIKVYFIKSHTGLWCVCDFPMQRKLVVLKCVLRPCFVFVVSLICNAVNSVLALWEKHLHSCGVCTFLPIGFMYADWSPRTDVVLVLRNILITLIQVIMPIYILESFGCTLTLNIKWQILAKQLYLVLGSWYPKILR